ncbi:MAG: hypothetical protein PHS57_08660 [Alphaproteobacteria bacterium]|nr:hypothetical protein [Alphaproteobacteria bacterium]
MGRKISEATPVVPLAGGHKLPILRTDGSNAVGEVPAGGFAKREGEQQFSGAQRNSVSTLTSVSNSTAVDLSLNNDFTMVMQENTTLANPTNIVPGQKGRIAILQGDTARTMGFGSYWKFAGGTVPTLSTTANATDILFYDVISDTQIAASLVKGFA